MNKTIGQIIRQLRKEQDLTQEELAERLNVTSQAVSRWESDTGMPDISQVVPIARVFGVSTDVLFGMPIINENAEIEKILDEYNRIVEPIECYTYMLKALEKHPMNTKLLCYALRDGATIIYCKLISDVSPVVKECERIANILISSGNDPDCISVAHRELATIYNVLGQYKDAEAHILKLPDTVMDQSKAFREQYFLRGDHTKVLLSDCSVFFNLLRHELILSILEIGKNYYRYEQYDNAGVCFKSLLDMINGLFGELPTYLCMDEAIIWLAKAYIKLNQSEKALETLEILPTLSYQQKQIVIGDEISTHPLIKPIGAKFTESYDKSAFNRDCLDALEDVAFEPIKNEVRFKELIKQLVE